MKPISDYNWQRVLYIIGIILFAIGTLDPLEGSFLILSGSVLIAVSVTLEKGPRWEAHIMAAILMAIGIIFLFYFSSIGGFGGTSTLSWWYAVLILPYPIGWVTTVILLIRRIKKKESVVSDHF